jgi:hypothetical protein
MFLMAPALAVGAISLALAGIPIVVHLLNRTRIKPIPWGAMQFLLASNIQQRRRQRIDQWLLMALRMLLLVLLIVILARPLVLTSAYNPFASGAASDVVVVIDHSLSTGRRSGERTLFAQGVQTFDQLTALLKPTDTVSVVLAEHVPRGLTPALVSGSASITRLHDTLIAEKPGATDGPIPDAIGAAREIAARGTHQRKIIVVLSDEQRSGWSIGNTAAWTAAVGNQLSSAAANTSIVALPMGEESVAGNVSVSQVSALPRFIGVNRPIEISAALTASGAALGTAFPVALIVDGRTAATQTVGPLTPGQTSTVRFNQTFTTPGNHWVKVEAQLSDSLDADNASFAALHVAAQMPALLIDGAPAGATGSPFLRAALAPSGDPSDPAGVVLHAIGVSQWRSVALDDYPIVIVNDPRRLPPELVNTLSRYVGAGHGLWWILGVRTDAAWLTEQAHTSLFPYGVGTLITEPTSTGMNITQPDASMVRLLASGGKQALSGVGVHQYWQVTAPPTATIAATANGTPLILSASVGTNGGRVVTWTTGVDGGMNNLPLATNFLPLVDQTVLALLEGSAAGQTQQIRAGDILTYTAPPGQLLQEATLTRPDGGALRVPPLITNNRALVSTNDTALPGLYELRTTPPLPEQPVYFSVAIDPGELDPLTLSQADIQSLIDQHWLSEHVTASALARVLGAENRGIDLWPYLTVLLIAALLGETYFARWLARRNSLAAVTAAVPLGVAA